MKIFVTNLKGFEGRRNWIKAHFNDFGLDFEFIDCIDGRKWKDNDLRKVVSKEFFEYHKRKESWVTKGAIAATLTHIERIFKRMVEDNIEYALCCEDDIKLSKDFKKKLQMIDEYIYRVGFDGVLLLHFFLNQSTKLSNLEKVQLDKEITVYKLPREFKVGSGAGYIISRQTAKKIIQDQSPIKRIGDCWNDHPIDNVFFAYPLIIRTGVFSTTLGYQGNILNKLTKLIPANIRMFFRMKKLMLKEENNIIK
jgi:glycosyl transferase family 25